MERLRDERGMALLAVVAVLIALVLIGTPFAIQMQSAADRSASTLFTERAEHETQSLIALANLYLLQGTDANERAQAASGEEEAGSLFTTPDHDTPEEFEIPASLIAKFNENSARGRIWDLRVDDEQSKINVNSAPYTLLANLLGGTVLTADLVQMAPHVHGLLMELVRLFPVLDESIMLLIRLSDEV